MDHLETVQHKAIRRMTYDEEALLLLLLLTDGPRRLLNSWLGPDCSVAMAGPIMSFIGASISTDVFSWLRETLWPPQTAATRPGDSVDDVVVVDVVVVVVVDVVRFRCWALVGDRFFRWGVFTGMLPPPPLAEEGPLPGGVVCCCCPRDRVQAA